MGGYSKKYTRMTLRRHSRTRLAPLRRPSDAGSEPLDRSDPHMGYARLAEAEDAGGGR
jgi:hypothetical protein